MKESDISEVNELLELRQTIKSLMLDQYLKGFFYKNGSHVELFSEDSLSHSAASLNLQEYLNQTIQSCHKACCTGMISRINDRLEELDVSIEEDSHDERAAD